MRRPSELWGRRTAALGLGLIALAALGAGLLVASDDDDDSGDGTTVSQEEVEEQVARLEDERLTVKVSDGEKGIAARIPKGWEESREQDLINLESGDRCVSVSLAAPAPSGDTGKLLDETIDGLRGQFKGAQVQRGAGQDVGGLDSRGAVLEVKGPNGDPVRVLITVGRGERFAYLTQVVLRDPACGESLVDSQLVVNSIEYTK
jgi:hypothetical protein